jgi:hypothetical protein
VLFTDIVGSTALRERLGEDRADAFQLTHDALLNGHPTDWSTWVRMRHDACESCQVPAPS